ncbi:2-nitropropane dioxygenase-like enzyme [Mycobacteroides abscessus]|nr:2-nitropropane dioxygenase-like enzyme [Mycobacteroides abscessus]SKG53826.1 2-nitropropane dioxygenase-like enzyme [Mycobacteroides abscessus subsp. massiliense]CPU62230.1 2-nitropropane dioxygenase-like enzyme [Mycobacteroides abscessus]SKH48328.1 2-nitropropane dioxygenase-like enzyme [Mycobacteroides abscessus subsp. massiliense]SKH97107.1 2-nitropropane dioxygenase-like enzyme [Mycobacteroides abscessus subsp. massiliense]
MTEWFDGPLLLSGAIAHGASILAALAVGADFAYVGSAFISTAEANATPEYKQMIVALRRQTSSTRTYSPAYTATTCAAASRLLALTRITCLPRIRPR